MIDFETLKKLIDTGESVCLKVNGNSMRPFLNDNSDSVVVKSIDRRLRKGDIIFYNRFDAVVVMHRIVKIKDDKMWLCGDAQSTLEGPLDVSKAFAMVCSVIHNEKIYDANSAYFRIYSKLWCRILSIRPYLIKKDFRHC